MATYHITQAFYGDSNLYPLYQRSIETFNFLIIVEAMWHNFHRTLDLDFLIPVIAEVRRRITPSQPDYSFAEDMCIGPEAFTESDDC